MPETLENIAIIQSQYLIHQAQNGDQKAFGRLVDLWYKRIYNFSLKYFGDHDLAMESTQKTIIAVYENIGKLKDNQRFRYWIYKIVLNQCRAEDRKRKQKPWHSIFHDKETLEVVSALTTLIKTESTGFYGEKIIEASYIDGYGVIFTIPGTVQFFFNRTNLEFNPMIIEVPTAPAPDVESFAGFGDAHKKVVESELSEKELEQMQAEAKKKGGRSRKVCKGIGKIQTGS